VRGLERWHDVSERERKVGGIQFRLKVSGNDDEVESLKHTHEKGEFEFNAREI
jgi:hypothetical protein